jgi:DNA-binding beta-propeller fold protein YncE
MAYWIFEHDLTEDGGRQRSSSVEKKRIRIDDVLCLALQIVYHDRLKRMVEHCGRTTMRKLRSPLAALVCMLAGTLAPAPLARAETLVPLVTTPAGSAGVSGSADGLGPTARLSDPSAVALGNGFALVADTQNHTIRKMALATGEVTTLAGSPRANGSATGVGSAARFFHPEGLALSVDGALALITDTDNHTIRQIILASGEVTTLAGSPGSPGAANGVGSIARFSSPSAVALGVGFALVADTGNHAIRRLDLATGEVTTLAGALGSPGSADGMRATARFLSPRGVALSSDGALALIADTGNHTLRALVVASGAVTTLAGSPGSPGSADGSGSAARFRYPRGVALSADGSIALVADFSNNDVRAVTLATGAVMTSAGAPGHPGSADGVGTSARFAYPAGIVLSSDATFALLADPDNQTIRRLDFVSLAPRAALPVLRR